jgi:hypothetical protein
MNTGSSKRRSPFRFLTSVIALIVITGLGCATAYAVSEYGEDRAIAALVQGNQVLYLRHTDRASGPKEKLSAASAPADYLDCSHQRNLTAKGRQQAVAFGSSWRALKIRVGKVYANAQCRTRDTAELAFGRAEVDPRLFNSEFVRKLLLVRPTDGTNTIIVGNDYQFFKLTGIELDRGEAAVVVPDGNGGVAVAATLDLDDWQEEVAEEQ